MSTFTINSKEFLKALNFAGKAVPNSAITPIFECVLLELNKSGVLLITGSDSNTVIQTSTKATNVDLEGESTVKIAAPFDLLSRTLATIPNAPVTVTYTVEGENFNLQIDYEDSDGRNAIFNMSCEDPKTYLRFPELGESETVSMKAQIFQRGIDSVINLVGEDMLKPSITGVNIVFSNNKVEFAGTTGSVIGIYTIEQPVSDLEKSFILPGKFAKLMSEFIGESAGNVELQVSSRFLKVSFEDWTAYSTLIDEKYPNCRAVIPQSFNHEATLNAERLRMAMKRASVYADPQASTMKMVYNEKNLFLSAEFPEKNQKCDQDIPIDSEIDGFQVGFNMKTLSKVLQTVSGDFKISFVAHNQGALINPTVDEGETIDYVIMPVITLT